MAEVFVSKAAEINEGDRRIIKTGKGEVGLFFEGGAYMRTPTNVRIKVVRRARA